MPNYNKCRTQKSLFEFETIQLFMKTYDSLIKKKERNNKEMHPFSPQTRLETVKKRGKRGRGEKKKKEGKEQKSTKSITFV